LIGIDRDATPQNETAAMPKVDLPETVRRILMHSLSAGRIHTITQLAPVDRFVFVISVLEGYSTKACSLLLDCAVDTVIEARLRALRQLGTADGSAGEAHRVFAHLTG